MKNISYKYWILNILLLLTSSLFGQTNRPDSLERAILTTKNPIERYALLDQLRKEIQDFELNKTLFVAKQMKEISLSTGYKNAFSQLVIGQAYYFLGATDSAQIYLQEVVKYVKNREDSVALSGAYNILGVLYLDLQEYDEGLDFSRKSAEIDRLLGDLAGASMSYCNVAAVYLMLEEFEKAKQVLNISEALAIEIGALDLLANAYTNLAYLHLCMDEYANSKTYSLKSIEIRKNLGVTNNLEVNYQNLAAVCEKTSDYNSAIEYGKKALEYALLSGDLSTVKLAYLVMSNSYEALGNYKQAYENHKLFTTWSDTLILRNNREAIIDIREKYNTEQTAAENEILIQQSLITDFQLAQNRDEQVKSNIIIWSSVLGLVLLLVLAFTLYNRNLIKQKANQQLHEANKIINEKNDDITASLEYARKIQEAILMNHENIELFPDSFIMFKPKDIVSGDFYWYTEVEGKKLFAAIDCTGHGVPGAFMSMIGNTFLNEIVNEKQITSPSKILDELRIKVIKTLNQKGIKGARRDGMDMSICMIDEKSMTMEYAGANNPVFMVQKGEPVEIKPDKQPVGYMSEKSEPFTNHAVSINKGDAIYIFSDGYADQFGGLKGKKFKYKKMKELFLQNYTLAMSQQKNILVNAFEDWKGELEQIDDVCVIGVKI